MTSADVIETWVIEVMRNLPARERNDIGVELRGLLTDMLNERAAAEGGVANDAMVLAMLRDFGTPAEVAARYRAPGVVIIPAEQTGRFALLAIVGIALQWGLTLPRVFQGQPVVAWWFSWGLGSLWWPGFLVMLALAAAFVRRLGLHPRAWQPRSVDAERIDRGTFGIGLFWIVVCSIVTACLPWLFDRLPAPLANTFALDPGFLHWRAPVVLPLWLLACVNLGIVYRQARWSTWTRRAEAMINLAFIALLAWWATGGPLFRTAAADGFTRTVLAFVALLVAFDLALKLYRSRIRIRPAGLNG